ncbi:MAG: bifunctional riboflavin kinase/FMN adenylyltransferase [Phycisphaerae bacterium]|nr:bifunctional riboflavin kinase/FMN adenylyltransferase [Phycisphaerae bacterium]
MLAITIGNFDGVHRGHQALIAEARRRAGTGGRVVAVTFDPHPVARLRAGAIPPQLTTLDDKRRLLAEAGADETLVLDPTPDLLRLGPEEFVRELRTRVPFDAIVEGDDFRFGKGRAGDVTTLAALGATLGFETAVVDAVDVELADQTLVRASSSMVRWLIAQGRVADAARILGRRYSLVGVTERGDQRGRTIGVPTLNLDHSVGAPRADGSALLLPSDGVYAGWVTLEETIDGGTPLRAAISVGTKPSFGESRRTCEAHAIDVTLPMDRYGTPMRVTFERWIRGQYAFSSLQALVEQIGRDVAAARPVAARSQD